MRASLLGNSLDNNGNASNKTTSIATTKILIDRILFTPEARFMTPNVKYIA